MTILNQNPVLQIFPGNNNTDFTFTFRLFPQVPGPVGTIRYAVKVFVWSGVSGEDPAEKQQFNDFTVQSVQNETGVVTMVRPVPSGQFVLISSDLPYTQEISFNISASNLANDIELALDRLSAQAKQLDQRLKTAVVLKEPPTSATFRIRIDPTKVVDQRIIQFAAVPGEPDHFEIVATDVTTDELRQLKLDTLNARDEAVAAAAQSQTSANNAAVSANNAATSAVAATTAANTAINAKDLAVTSANNAAASAASAATSATSAANSATLAQAEADRAENAANKIPDPVAVVEGRGIITDGNDGWSFKNIPNTDDPLNIPNQVLTTTGSNLGWDLKEVPIVEGLQASPVGSVATVDVDQAGFKFLRAGNMPIVASSQVSTVSPGLEGGVDVSQALQNINSSLSFIQNNSSIRPWNLTDVIAELRVLKDADLISEDGAFKIKPIGSRDVEVVNVGSSFYYGSGSSYVLPPVLGSSNQQSVTDPWTIIFTFLPLGTFQAAVLFNRPDLQITYIPNGTIRITSGSTLIDTVITLDTVNMVCVTIDGTNIKGYIARLDTGSVLVTDIVPGTIPAPLAPGGFNFATTPDGRFVDLVLLKLFLSQSLFEEYANIIFGTLRGSVPSASGEPDGQVPVTKAGEYVLDFGITIANVPTNYTVDTAVDFPTELADDGTYTVRLKKDSTNQTLKVILMAEQKVVQGIRNSFVGISHTAATLLMPANENREEIVIQNRLDDSVFIGLQADLSPDKTNGTKVGSGKTFRTSKTDALYAIAESVTEDANGVLVAVENVFVDI